MPEANLNLINENLSITVTRENNGYYLCQLSNPLPDSSQNTISCYGQTQEHSIAIVIPNRFLNRFYSAIAGMTDFANNVLEIGSKLGIELIKN